MHLQWGINWLKTSKRVGWNNIALRTTQWDGTNRWNYKIDVYILMGRPGNTGTMGRTPELASQTDFKYTN